MYWSKICEEVRFSVRNIGNGKKLRSENKAKIVKSCLFIDKTSMFDFLSPRKLLLRGYPYFFKLSFQIDSCRNAAKYLQNL